MCVQNVNLESYKTVSCVFSGQRGKKQIGMKFFAFLKTILKNYKIVIWYAVTVYNSKII